MKIECPDEGLCSVVSDVHEPWADKRVQDIYLKSIQTRRPHTVVLNGDIIDNFELSDHMKSPAKAGTTFQKELDAARPFIMEIRKWCKRVVYGMGNHENRYWKRVMEQPGLYGLRAMSFGKLAELPDDVLVFPYGTMILWGDTIIYHGDITAKNVATTGWNRFSSQLVLGHAHRSSTFQHTHPITKERTYVVAAGTLCDFAPVDFTAHPPWNHGWAEIRAWKDAAGRRRTRPYQVEVEGYSVVLGDKTYHG